MQPLTLIFYLKVLRQFKAQPDTMQSINESSVVQPRGLFLK